MEPNENDEAPPASRMAAAAMAEQMPAPPSVPTRRISSAISESGEYLDVLDLITKRVDQIARLNQEQWNRSEQVLKQMLATMELMQLIIGQQDEAVQRQDQQIIRLETAIVALVKVNSNLSEIAAALITLVD